MDLKFVHIEGEDKLKKMLEGLVNAAGMWGFDIKIYEDNGEVGKLVASSEKE